MISDPTIYGKASKNIWAPLYQQEGKKMDAKFTKGPWRVEEFKPTARPNIVISSDSGPIAAINATPKDSPQRWQNARLIAACPLMYEELAKIGALIELAGGNHVRWDVVLEEINSILAKVAGEA